MATPLQPIAGRQGDILLDQPLRLRDVPADVASAHVDEYRPDELAVLTLDHRSTRTEAEIRELGQRYLLTARSGNENLVEPRRIAPKVACISYLHRIALASLDYERDVPATEHRSDNPLHVPDGEPIPRDRFPIGMNVEVTASERSLGEDAGGSPKRG